MAARQRETDFNDYFDFLWEQAQERKLTKGQFMKASGLSAQRFSEFTQQSRNVTAEYFLKMLGGLGLTPEDVEKGSGIPFSEDQSVQLKFDSFVSSQRAFIEELMRNPEKLRACKAVVALGGVWENRQVQRVLNRLKNVKALRRFFNVPESPSS